MCVLTEVKTKLCTWHPTLTGRVHIFFIINKHNEGRLYMKTDITSTLKGITVNNNSSINKDIKEFIESGVLVLTQNMKDDMKEDE